MKTRRIFLYSLILSIQNAEAHDFTSKLLRHNVQFVDTDFQKNKSYPQKKNNPLHEISSFWKNPESVSPTPINFPLFILLRGNQRENSPPSLSFQRDIETPHERYNQIAGLLGRCHEAAIRTKESFYCQTNWMITSAYDGPVNSSGNFVVERPPDALLDHQGPRSSITALTAVAKDDTEEASSRSGGMGALEADIYADGLDTTGGAPNNRTLALLVIDSLHHGSPMSVSQGLLIGTNSDDAYYGKTLMLDGKFSTSAIDLRETKPMCQTDQAGAHCPPVIWMGDNMNLTYSSDGTTTQKYNSHNGNLEFTVGGKKSFSLDANSGTGLFYYGLNIPDDQKISIGNSNAFSFVSDTQNKSLEIKSKESISLKIDSETGSLFFLKNSYFQKGLYLPNFPENDDIWSQKHPDGFLINNPVTHQLFVQENGIYKKLQTDDDGSMKHQASSHSSSCNFSLPLRKVSFASLPAKADTGEVVFCPDCYSTLQPSNDRQTGIAVTFNGKRWNDALGLAILHN